MRDQTQRYGSIVFNGGPGRGLYAIDVASGTLRQLALGEISAARWSPDGRKLAFEQWIDVERGPAIESLYVLVPGTEPRRVLTQTAPFIPYTWSPDGRRLAFSQAGAIWVVPSDGGRKRRLTYQGKDTAPVWSPDGRAIAFLRAGEHAASDLYVMNRDGSHQRRLAVNGGSPDWSPDGKQLVYAANARAPVFVINRDGTGRHRILGKGNSVDFRWSPDGRWIALTGGVGNETGTFVVHPDGSGLRRLSGLGNFSAPSWSPDSRTLAIDEAWDGKGCCAPDIWIVALDGGTPRRLTDGWRYGYGNYNPEWNPRGFPAERLAGTSVTPSLPTDSVADSSTLRTTHPITSLIADGPAVAAAYGRYPICTEVWAPAVPSLTTFPGCLTPTGFGFAGGRVAWSHFERGGGVISWDVETATVDTPRVDRVKKASNTNYPLSDFVGDGSLFMFDSWGPCYRDGPAVCLPKANGTLYRLDGTNAVKIASSAGALTPLSVDAGRILVDHENGTLELMRPDGTSLQTFHVYLGDFLGAKLQGRDVVVLKHATIADYDADTGALLHEWPFATNAERTLEDVLDGIAVYVSGATVHLFRLADGHEAVIQAPGSGPVLAQLEPSGLFYSYTDNDPKYRGRVVFVPHDQLPLR